MIPKDQIYVFEVDAADSDALQKELRGLESDDGNPTVARFEVISVVPQEPGRFFVVCR